MCIGGRKASPFGPVPSSNTFSACASVKLGNPASAGARSAQLAMGATGLIQMGAPLSQAPASSSPSGLRGVWHSGHFATSSTRYRPRSTSTFVGGPGIANRLWNASEEIATVALASATNARITFDDTLISPHFRPDLEQCAIPPTNRLHRKEPMFCVGVSKANPVFHGSGGSCCTGGASQKAVRAGPNGFF